MIQIVPETARWALSRLLQCAAALLLGCNSSFIIHFHSADECAARRALTRLPQFAAALLRSTIIHPALYIP